MISKYTNEVNLFCGKHKRGGNVVPGTLCPARGHRRGLFRRSTDRILLSSFFHQLMLAFRALQVFTFSLGYLLEHIGMLADRALPGNRSIPAGEIALGIVAATIENSAIP